MGAVGAAAMREITSFPFQISSIQLVDLDPICRLFLTWRCRFIRSRLRIAYVGDLRECMMLGKFWKNSLSRRIMAQIALTGVIVALIGAAGLQLYYKEMLSERLQSLRTITELFTTYAQSLETRVRNGALTREAALAELAETAMAMRFDGGTNYVAIYAMDGTALAVPDRRLVGSNQLDTRVNGVRAAGTLIGRLKTSDTATLSYLY